MIHIQEVRAPADIFDVHAQARLQNAILERAAAQVVVPRVAQAHYRLAQAYRRTGQTAKT